MTAVVWEVFNDLILSFYNLIYTYVMKHMSGYNVSLPWASCGNLWNNNLTCVDVGSTKAGQADLRHFNGIKIYYFVDSVCMAQAVHFLTRSNLLEIRDATIASSPAQLRSTFSKYLIFFFYQTCPAFYLCLKFGLIQLFAGT